MEHNQARTPLLQKLKEFNKKQPISFHVPGHKNGEVFLDEARAFYKGILSIDMTELTNLDDLHSPHGVIAEAEELASEFFESKHTFFLVGGSTVGNLAMILATCSQGEKIIVQRNSHKSIINALELSGAMPIFIAPEYDRSVDRYTNPSIDTLEAALKQYPDAKAVVLTYPDYFGKTYPIEKMIQLAHTYNMPVLVDEAHGVHFSVGKPFPVSALTLGADAVVQSAHKMAPAMTMGSFLHLNSNRISESRVAHYLQMLQSSSPSYPLMASLDIARAFLANISQETIRDVISSVTKVRDILATSDFWSVLPASDTDDPLKITLQVEPGVTGYDVAFLFEQQGIYPELATTNQLLFIHGLLPFKQLDLLTNAIKIINQQLKKDSSHATIDITKLFPQTIEKLAQSYQSMNQTQPVTVKLSESKGYVAAEAIIPYPPGIPLILKGERIMNHHIQLIQQLIEQGATIQHRDLQTGIRVYSG